MSKKIISGPMSAHFFLRGRPIKTPEGPARFSSWGTNVVNMAWTLGENGLRTYTRSVLEFMNQDDILKLWDLHQKRLHPDKDSVTFGPNRKGMSSDWK